MTSQYFIHHWLIDTDSASLINKNTGEQRRLGEYQLKLLITLIQNAGQILAREQLNTLVWGQRVVGNNSLPNAIHALRAALEDDGKQQRFIRTIPKKGYILDAEFCYSHGNSESTEENSSQTPHNVAEIPLTPLSPLLSPVNLTQDTLQPTSLVGNEPVTHNLKKRHPVFRQKIGLAKAIMLFMMIISLSKEGYHDNHLIEKNIGLYSNIRLFESSHNQNHFMVTKNVNELLNNTLLMLNQRLKSKQTSMKVYLFTHDSYLKYAMTLTNRCEQRHLTMNIFHWQQDYQKFNTLIYRETERKLNEITRCIH